MTWLNPWALAGVLGIVLPAIIHLLGRGHAQSRRFPSLRFVERSPLLPTRRTRIHDPLLLAIRAGIIALASMALAQPLLLTPMRRSSLDRGLARAIIVDTSWSMRSRSAAGRTAMESARDSARALAAQARAAVVVETAEPGRSLAAAAEWALRQQRRAEIVVLSDFQVGTLDSVDVARIPPTIGVRLTRISGDDSARDARVFASGGRAVAAQASFAGERTAAQWTTRAAQPVGRAVTMLAGPGAASALAATRAASDLRAVALPIDTLRRIVVVFDAYPGRDTLRAALSGVRAAWMADLLARLHRNGVSITASGEAEVEGRRSLVLLTSAAPGSLESARLVAEAEASASVAAPAHELDERSISPASIGAWSRAGVEPDAARSRSAVGDDGPSDARWVWLAVLGLLGVEMIVRRSRAAAGVAPSVDARAA